MPPHVLILLTALLAADGTIEPEHAKNPVYSAVLEDGLSVESTLVRLPGPVLLDEMSAEMQHAACRTLAGSDTNLNELLRNSVTAPFEIKNRSVPYDGGTIRVVNLWFIVHADLDEIDARKLSESVGQGEPVEAGNMRFEAHRLTADELTARKINPANDLDIYVHARVRLLDRIGLEATNRSFATHSAESWVIASQTLRTFDQDRELANRWWPIKRRDAREEAGPAKPYAGSVSYTKISRLKFKPGALLIEAHTAFAEPKAWFDGAPILRSKFSVVAQDQIRRLRREIAKHRSQKDDAKQ